MDDFIQIPSFLTDGMNISRSDMQPMACGSCLDFCEVYDECCGYENCMNPNQSGCQTSCEKNCQTSCEKNCQTSCEKNCQLSCEKNCQYACENYCMTECESCETACQGTCLSACQVCEGVCQTSCEIYCENCQTSCQKNCQTSCQTGCQSGQQPSIVPWEWSNPKTSGTGFNVTRAEWISFQNKINEVRVSKAMPAYGFTTSTTYIDKDKDYYAWIWLQAANAINDINGQVASTCLNVSSGDDIYAWYFDNLKTALNNAIN